MARIQPPGDDELDEMAQQVSNWGRWGDEDQLGTLNLITAEARARALATATDGTVVSMARPLPLGKSPQLLQSVHNVWRLSGRVEGASDFIGMVFHNWAVTHLDCPSHVHDKGRMYNGFDVTSALTSAGAQRCAVDATPAGISGRGVLLDIAAARGVSRVDGTEAITPEDLETAEHRHGVSVEGGDILFVRFGQNLWEAHDCPGLDPSCVPWLRERHVSLLATDVNSDVYPRRSGRWPLPIHQMAQVYLGMPLIDNCALEDLSRACRERGRYAFFAVIAPLNMVGATGSPVNPLAFF